MIKKVIFAAIALVALAQVGHAEVTSTHIDHTNHRLLMDGEKIWVEDKNWKALAVNSKPIQLYIDEATPTFYALVYNTLKDHFIRKKGKLAVYTEEVTSPTHGTYAKIVQIHFQ